MKPKVLLAVDIARILGWPVQRARRWMISSGAGTLIGRRWVTTPSQLRDAWKGLYDEIILDLYENDGDEHQ